MNKRITLLAPDRLPHVHAREIGAVLSRRFGQSIDVVPSPSLSGDGDTFAAPGIDPETARALIRAARIAVAYLMNRSLLDS